MNGQVVRLVRQRGFGFIRDTHTGKEYFFHATGLRAPLDYSELQEGDAVTFETERSDKGPRAAQVALA